jgi:glycosyltransferase involved in cell wall biosynthesis
VIENRIKILYVVSNIDKALAFEWISDRLNKKSFEIIFILIGKKNTALFQYLNKTHVTVYELPYDGKKDFALTFFRLFKIIFKTKPHVVHTHLFEGNLVGLTAAWLLRVKKRIYTRHHATIHYNEFPKGLKWDKWCNWIATDIIAISNNIREILIDWDKAQPQKVHLIHHGFDFDYFEQVNTARVYGLRLKYDLTISTKPVIGMISRYMDWKGVQYTIQAFEQLLSEYPHAHLILANAQGNYENQIRLLLKDLPASSYTEIPFEYDLAALYKVFDIFVHVPTDRYSEAFGQIYVESLLAGVPSIFTKSGIACEFIVDGQNALVVDYKNSNQIYDCLVKLLQDDNLRNKLVKNGKNTVTDFSITSYLLKLENLYSSHNE